MTALAIVYGLLGQAVPWLPGHGVPVQVTVEADLHIDDLIVDFDDGTRAFVQAKLSCDLGATLDSVAKQWAAALEAGELPPGASAVLAVAGATSTLADLAAALNNARNGTAQSVEQQKALGKLRGYLIGHLADPSNVESVLHLAHVAVVDGRDSDRGAAWLAGTVVDPPSGRHAFDTIRAAIPRLAAARGHATLDDWRRWLREAQVPTHADPQGVVAARAQAEDNELDAYRAAMAAHMDLLPLGVLAAGRAPLRIDGLAESVTVAALEPEATTGEDASSDAGSSEWLVWVRRETRLLLIGQPGSGKSVALQQTAARLAGLPFAPVPILVPLRQVADMMRAGRAAAVTIGELVELGAPGSSAILRRVLEARVRDGQAVLLLDALDETGERLEEVVAGLRVLLNAAHHDLGVVVSSRYASLDAARTLELHPRLLTQPRHLDDDMDAVLRSLAPDPEDPARPSWLASRRAYIAESRKKLSEIWTVPLLAVLATGLVAANQTAPATRAGLLTDIIQASVRDWETRKKDALLPGADRRLTADMLIDTFGDLAAVVADDGDWHTAQQNVVDRLHKHWGLSPGEAGTVADAIVEHWDATAAVFITDMAHGRLRPQARLFAEIGEALYRSRAHENLASWARSVSDDAHRQETLRLTAGLSTANMATLAPVAADAGAAPLLDAVSDAWHDGQQPTAADAEALVQAQLALLQTESKEAPPRTDTGIRAFLTDRVPPFVRRATRICRLPLTDGQRRQLLTLCSELSNGQRDVLEGLALVRQDPDKPPVSAAALDRVERLLLTDEDIAGGSEHTRKQALHGFSELLDLTTDAILTQRPHLARRLGYTAEQTSNSTYTFVRQSVALRGLENELPPMARDYATMNRQMERYRRGQVDLFDALRAALPEAVGKLTPAQRWNIDEAAQLVATLRIGESSGGDPDQAVRHHRELTVAAIAATAQAMQLDQYVAAAQLDQLRTENPDDPDWTLLFHAARWNSKAVMQTEQHHLSVALDTLRTSNHWLQSLGLQLYLRVGTLTDDDARQLFDALPDLTVYGRRDAAVALHILRPDFHVPDDDAATRGGLAAVTAATARNDRRPLDALPYLRDPDLTVREQTVQQLTGLTEVDRATAQTALNEPATQWTCLQCGQTCTASDDRCDQSHPRPQPTLK